MIKAILFDLGGVIIDLDFKKCLDNFRTEIGFTDTDSLIDLTHQSGIYSRLEAGQLTPEEFRSIVIEASNPGTTPDDVDRVVKSLLCGIDPRKVTFLEELSAKWPVYMLSNNNPISMPCCHKIMEEAGLDEEKIFQKEFLSWEMGLLKPSPEIFLSAIKEIGIPSSEILFVDDSERNIIGAESVGLRTLHYHQGDDLGKDVYSAILKYSGGKADA